MKFFWYCFWLTVFAFVPAFVVGSAIVMFAELSMAGYIVGGCLFGFSMDVLWQGTSKLRRSI